MFIFSLFSSDCGDDKGEANKFSQQFLSGKLIRPWILSNYSIYLIIISCLSILKHTIILNFIESYFSVIRERWGIKLLFRVGNKIFMGMCIFWNWSSFWCFNRNYLIVRGIFEGGGNWKLIFCELWNYNCGLTLEFSFLTDFFLFFSAKFPSNLIFCLQDLKLNFKILKRKKKWP